VSRRAIVIVAVLVAGAGLLALLAGAAGWWYWTRTPTYSLTQVQEALRTHDLPLFEKHVDVDGLTNSIVDGVIAEMKAPAGGSKDPWERAGQALGAGLVQLMRPQIAEEARRNIREYVRTGRTAADHKLQKAGKPGQPGHGREEGALAVLGAVENVDVQGNVAEADVAAKTAKGQPVRIRVRMRDMGGYWQVTEIVNAQEVVRAFTEEPAAAD
jgi:hypothetical protein